MTPLQAKCQALFAGAADARESWAAKEPTYARLPEGGHDSPMLGCPNADCLACAYWEGWHAGVMDSAAAFFRALPSSARERAP